MRVCSTDLSHHKYRRGCTVPISHIIDTDEGAQYRITESAQGIVGGCTYLRQ